MLSVQGGATATKEGETISLSEQPDVVLPFLCQARSISKMLLRAGVQDKIYVHVQPRDENYFCFGLDEAVAPFG